MSMAAGAAVLRSMATKMARAPPRLPTSSGGRGLCLPTSRFSTSTGGSMPLPSANLKGPQPPNNNKVPSDSQFYRAIVGFNEALPIGALFLFGGFIYVHFVANPAMDRKEANLDAHLQALVTMREEGIKKCHERRRAMLLSDKESQAEAADVSEGDGMEHL